MELKKGAMVTVIRDKLEGSVEAQGNDTRWSSYIFETQGEIVELRGDYAQIKFGAVPTPPIWLNKEQIQPA
jgi:hypothetical protein